MAITIVGFIVPEIAPFDPLTPRPHLRTKHEMDQMIHCGNMAFLNFQRWRPAAILDLIETEIAPFDTQTPKTIP